MCRSLSTPLLSRQVVHPAGRCWAMIHLWKQIPVLAEVEESLGASSSDSLQGSGSTRAPSKECWRAEGGSSGQGQNAKLFLCCFWKSELKILMLWVGSWLLILGWEGHLWPQGQPAAAAPWVSYLISGGEDCSTLKWEQCWAAAPWEPEGKEYSFLGKYL